MSVMSCSRNCCDSVMCDRYSANFGYICPSCYTEMVEAQKKNIDFSIDKFMRSIPISATDKEVDLNEVFMLS